MSIHSPGALLYMCVVCKFAHESIKESSTRLKESTKMSLSRSLQHNTTLQPKTAVAEKSRQHELFGEESKIERGENFILSVFIVFVRLASNVIFRYTNRNILPDRPGGDTLLLYFFNLAYFNFYSAAYFEGGKSIHLLAIATRGIVH